MDLKGKLGRRLLGNVPGSVVRWKVNPLIKEYGEMLDFHWDPEKRTIRAKVLLKGEARPLEIEILEYELLREDRQARIRVIAARSDRDWVHALIQQFVVNREWPLPLDKVGWILDLMGPA